jgi:hypothetical protein
MPKSTCLRGCFAFLCASLIGSAADAQLFRAYLSGAGSDANPGAQQAPCRLLPAALNAVANGGEIWMLDSANYNTGTVTIGKSVSILAVPGAVGSIVALNDGPAISITASGLTISLRNVVIGPVAGATPGTHGVQMTGASNLTIEGCLHFNLPSDGVAVFDGTLKGAGTTLRNNGGSAIGLGARTAATRYQRHIGRTTTAGSAPPPFHRKFLQPPRHRQAPASADRSSLAAPLACRPSSPTTRSPASRQRRARSRARPLRFAPLLTTTPPRSLSATA